MTKSTKRNVIVSAVLAIVMCMSLMVGGTFAIFTSASKVNIAVTSGKVDVKAEISEFTVYSPKSISMEENNSIIDDSNAAIQSDGAETGTFANGGTATLSYENGAANIKLENITPGDKVSFKIAVKNYSNVKIKYRTSIKDVTTGLVAGEAALFDALEFTVGGMNVVGKSKWVDLDPATNDESGVELATYECTVKLPTTAGDDYQGKSCTLQYVVEAVQGNTLVEKHYDTLEEAFGLAAGTIASETRNEALVLDGNNDTYIDKWVDGYTAYDLTIKNVIFMNGTNISITKDNVAVTFENCTFYACDQDKAVKDLGITDKTTGEGNNGRNNVVTNTGAGMCLNLEVKTGTSGAILNVTGCTFIGENDPTLPAYGDKYGADGKTIGYKKRGHAIVLNAIAGGGGGNIKSLNIDNCEITGVRGNAIQLYGTKGDITIKDTKINSWGVNAGGFTYGTTTDDANSFAIRGDYSDNRTITLSNVYFGLDESTSVQDHVIGHVFVGNYPGNTDKTRKAGTYSYPEN